VKAFITGIEGFAGHYLARHLRSQGLEVSGSYFDEPLTAGLPRDCRLHRLDLRDRSATAAAIATARPERIYHLAAQSSAALSFKDPALTYDINVGGLVNLLEAVRMAEIRPRFLLVSSCEVYGPTDAARPIAETQSCNPVSPYAASKVAQEVVGLQHYRSFGLEVVVARPFPHVGAGQPPVFALPGFARQIAEIAHGRQSAVINVGNLDAQRDLSHVQDVVEAYTLLAERGPAGEAYNICSGSALSIGQALEKMLALSGRQITVAVDPQRLRPNDVPVLWGDNAKIKAQTGWTPRRTIDEALRELLDHWMNRT
jgi:GDP-4-dehydro-6-deoxy-D-mannose reductase